MTYSTPFNNHGNYIVSLGQLTPPGSRHRPRALGVEVFPGFAAAEAVFDEDGARQRACASATWASTRDGKPGPNYTPGPEIRAPLTVFAEGCRGQSPSS